MTAIAYLVKPRTRSDMELRKWVLKLSRLWDLMIRRSVNWDVAARFPVVVTRNVPFAIRSLLGTLVRLTT